MYVYIYIHKNIYVYIYISIMCICTYEYVHMQDMQMICYHLYIYTRSYNSYTHTATEIRKTLPGALKSSPATIACGDRKHANDVLDGNLSSMGLPQWFLLRN